MPGDRRKRETDFLTGLMNRLEAICLRALVVEIQYSRASGLLGDGNPGEQYGQFVETYLRDGERMQSFWEAYPQLYDLVTDEMQRYGDYLEEILGNLERDRQALADHMGIRGSFAPDCPFTDGPWRYPWSGESSSGAGTGQWDASVYNRETRR